MSITREQVKALQALERDTVPLPWHVGPYYKCDVHGPEQRPEQSYIVRGSSVCPADTRDAKFIVEARNALPALITTWLSMADRLARVEKVLNNPHSIVDDCGCSRCRNAITVSDFKCDNCGYSGTPYCISCQCYDMRCAGHGSNGAGCPHGAFVCPVCDDKEGDVDAWGILKSVRAALAGDTKALGEAV